MTSFIAWVDFLVGSIGSSYGIEKEARDGHGKVAKDQ